MIATKPAMKMPELQVYAKLLATGFIGAEVCRVAFYLGANFIQKAPGVPAWARVCIVLAGLLLCLAYSIERDVHNVAGRMARSFRIDLLVAIGVGIWANELASPWLIRVHAVLMQADPRWAPTVLLLLCTVLLSPLVQRYWPRPERTPPQLYFVADEEIGNDAEDVLASEVQARSFAETVLASGAHAGLVFGVDGPWGVGKTSFINLAERHWEADDKVIVCRFELLRYASEPDLADRLIRDLSAAIQRRVFAPEFRPAVSRYSRLIRGKADVSFLGFKLSMEPSEETIEELLDDIDEVLRRIRRRVIIVVDDLDRLDAKTTNSVLFATRRTLRLSQATYVLCYDTEVLAGGNDEGSRAREFLEKFVTVKLSLFVDSSSLRDFLQRDWQRADKQLGSIPSDTMVKLGAVLNELASILGDTIAAKYLPLVGDLRKVKRFVNAMLLMQIEKSKLGRTDFNKRDLINLMLLHLNYPGMFRRIYAEETDSRSGIFSVRREHGQPGFTNSLEFSQLIEYLMKEKQETVGFLLKQLFDVETLELGDRGALDEAVQSSRACFNSDSYRNLEGYLRLIVRFATPEPQDTYVLYQEAVENVTKGEPISSVLTSPDFQSARWEHAHDQFWRVLVNQSHDLMPSVAGDAIDTLVDYLPCYPSIDQGDRALRQRSIYSLLRLLDRVGWKDAAGRHRENTPENVKEVAWRIFGELTYTGKGLLQRLTTDDRGVLGWNDLMLFRLQCSQDRQGQLYNVYRALVIHQDPDASTTGPIYDLVLPEMRRLSQEIFALFKRTYIDQQRNFFAEVDRTPVDSFLGRVPSPSDPKAPTNGQSVRGAPTPAERLSAAVSGVKSFVIYQLSNSRPPNQSGIGCGYYDENGQGDGGEIARQMNEYAFGVCFNPDVHEANVFHFLDHCLSHLSNSFFSDRDEVGLFASKGELLGGLDPKAMGRYWSQHRELIRRHGLAAGERQLVTFNYTVLYRENLADVFKVLEELADEATAGEADSDKR
ncbi:MULTISPECIES: P-loop NTPase fold protein [Paraburkholderia]|uniref:KAP family NTPase n=1 Tax=Paraburkholderia acidicola TaxID=1912599 RepID=A0ABV1M029_9BURK